MSVQGLRTLPTQAEFNQYNANAANMTNILPWTFYHKQAYAAAGQSVLTFFNAANGQGGLNLEDTNMQLPGQLPAPQRFIATGLELDFKSGSPIGSFGAEVAPDYSLDVDAVVNSGYWEMIIGNTVYAMDYPIKTAPPQQRLAGFAAASDATTAAANLQTLVNYAQAAGIPCNLGPFGINASQNFSLSVKWATPVATPSTVAGTLTARLSGFLFRPVQ